MRKANASYTRRGTAVVEVDVAINGTWKSDSGEKRKKTFFVNITLFGRTAEVAAKYCHKGDPLFVSGRLHLDTWDDKQTGQKRSKLKVVREQIQLLGTRQQAPANKPASPAPTGPPAKSRS